jgi:hypothetical protein
MVMLPGAGNALHVRQCGMVFHDKVRFNGIDIHVISKQAKGNPFLLRSPDDWKMNLLITPMSPLIGRKLLL